MEINAIDDVELIAISEDSDSGEIIDYNGAKGLNKSIIAIFSVVFDLTSGPKIEFQYVFFSFSSIQMLFFIYFFFDNFKSFCNITT